MSELGKQLREWLARADLDIKTDWGRINVLLGGAMANGAENMIKGRSVPYVVRRAVRELVACADVDEAVRLRCQQRLEQMFDHAEKHYGTFGTAPDGRPLEVWKAEVRQRVHERFGVPLRTSANARRRRRAQLLEAA
jgi:hypothetical protein